MGKMTKAIDFVRNAKGEPILMSNAPVNRVSSGTDFMYSIFSGISKMLSPQSYTKKNLTRGMKKRTNIARDYANGKITRNEKGEFEGISHLDRLKLAHMNKDGTYNKAAIAGSSLVAFGGLSAATHMVGGDEGVPGIPLI